MAGSFFGLVAHPSRSRAFPGSQAFPLVVHLFPTSLADEQFVGGAEVFLALFVDALDGGPFEGVVAEAACCDGGERLRKTLHLLPGAFR